VEAGRRVGAAAQGAYREAVGAARRESPLLSALLPLALLLLPLLLFTWLMRGAASKIEQQAPQAAVAPAPDRPRIEAATEVRAPEPSQPVTTADRPLIPTSLTVRELRLPDGVTLSLPESSFLHEVYKYLTDATATQGRAFVFDGLDYDNVTIRPRPETETAVTNLSALLHAFPRVNLRIDGHTDPTGDQAADRNRSLAQAEALKVMLVRAGVPSDRITTAGLGSEHPVTTNDTPEGRAKNRRIELSLTKPT
jgi:outer membrane protein OmpA-like peptidoglycan-associated protein